MDVSILFLAVPVLSASLAPSAVQLLWISDIYGFLIAGSLLTMGAVGDRVGSRRLLMIGAVAFAGASLLAAFATTPEMLIAARAVLGVAGATLAPSSMAILRSMFRQERQRRLAIGVWMSCFAAGAAVGPLVGGALLEHFWWGSAFLLNVPVMGALLACAAIVLPESPTTRARIDLAGAALSIAAILLLTYAVKMLADEGLSATAVTSLVAGVAVGGVFLRQQQGTAHPLVESALLRTSTLRVCAVAIVLSAFVMAGLLFYLAQHLQLVANRGPFSAGLWMLPIMVATVVGSMSAPVLLERRTASAPLATALAFAGIGLALVAMLDAQGFTLLVAGSVLVGLGAGAAGTISTDTVISAAPVERAGAASALSETGSELGGALGVALLGSVGAAVYRDRISAAIPPDLTASIASAVRDSRTGADGIAHELPGAVLRAADTAFIDALQAAALTASALCALAAAAAALVARRATAESAPLPLTAGRRSRTAVTDPAVTDPAVTDPGSSS